MIYFIPSSGSLYRESNKTAKQEDLYSAQSSNTTMRLSRCSIFRSMKETLQISDLKKSSEWIMIIERSLTSPILIYRHTLFIRSLI